jgi:hypothetical protein
MRAFVIASIVVAGVAGSASALTIQARLDSINPDVNMSVSNNAGVSFQTLRSGVNNFTVLGGDATELAPTFKAFCIDLNQTINFNTSYSFTKNAVESAPLPGGGMGGAKADLLRELWGRHFLAIDSNTKGSAFQIAVWEIVFDTGLDLSDGQVRVTGNAGVLAQAQSYMASLTGDSGYFAPVYALSSSSTQDMLVPTPGAIALMGLSGLIIGRRRR